MEKGNIEGAEHYIEKGLYLSKPEKPYYIWNSFYKVALLNYQKKYHQALELINEINFNSSETLSSVFLYISALWESRINLKLGNKFKAKEILSSLGIKENSLVQYGLEEGYLILFNILLEEEKISAAIGKQLKIIEENAQLKGDKKLYIETLLLSSRLEKKLGNRERAEKILEKAKKVAEDSGYYQIIKEEKINIPIQVNSSQNSYDLVEDLTTRELEILQLLGLGFSNQQIADKLFLTVGTVKWYTSNIYGKLGVKSRTQAVAMGRKLKLFD
ncbi:regulatory protein, luxR family [Anaerobranca gottschalkii DSM 13577]|uniref:Regulatory protein, luxR family n=2 Tax=Anaerobranca gottschalkii TaxID=108328 RepID=A0A1H9ZNQ6_9FIRM|nr:regulatory protein, luxR family [Anaerobranca gottschalkii DSM 13577]